MGLFDFKYYIHRTKDGLVQFGEIFSYKKGYEKPILSLSIPTSPFGSATSKCLTHEMTIAINGVISVKDVNDGSILCRIRICSLKPEEYRTIEHVSYWWIFQILQVVILSIILFTMVYFCASLVQNIIDIDKHQRQFEIYHDKLTTGQTLRSTDIILNSGKSIGFPFWLVPNRNYDLDDLKLVMQKDGNAVIYNNFEALLWSSETLNTDCYELEINIYSVHLKCKTHKTKEFKRTNYSDDSEYCNPSGKCVKITK